MSDKINDSSSSVEDGDKLYTRRADLVLDFLSDSYLLLNLILVEASGTFLIHLILFTDYLYY